MVPWPRGACQPFAWRIDYIKSFYHEGGRNLLLIEIVSVLVASHVHLFVTSWTVARQAPLSMEFSRQEYWSGLPFPSPKDLPNPGIEPRSSALQAGFLPTELQGSPIEIDISAFAIFAHHASVRNITYSMPATLFCPWNSPDENTGMGCCFLLQEDSPDQVSDPCLLHWQVDSLPLSHQGSPIVNEWNTFSILLKRYSEEGWEGGGDICIFMVDSLVVRQKPMQHCKANIL